MELIQLIEQVQVHWLNIASQNQEFDSVPVDILCIYKLAKDLINKDTRQALEYCNATLEAVWEQLNIGHWSSVPMAPRRLYSQASLLKCLLLLEQARSHLKANETDHKCTIDLLRDTLRACDMGLLLGAPLPNNALQDVAQILSCEKAKLDIAVCNETTEATDVQTNPEQLGDDDLPPAHPVPTLQCPSLELFYTQHLCPKKPLLLTNCIEHWPARTKWNATYLKQIAGGRTVPVELGSHYADEDWSQQLMTIDKFVDQHLLDTQNQDSKPVGYLAQHQLFDQIPELRNDIYEPEYCCLREPKSKSESGSTSQNSTEAQDDVEGPDVDDEEENADINAWFGPAGTLSPLHYDPKHNILAQVKGVKRVWLFSPEDSSFLYPHATVTLLSNTAQVDPEKPDLNQFPEYTQAKAYRCILRPGDCLYIPPKWWHHVRALTPSMSVSFWWE